MSSPIISFNFFRESPSNSYNQFDNACPTEKTACSPPAQNILEAECDETNDKEIAKASPTEEKPHSQATQIEAKCGTFNDPEITMEDFPGQFLDQKYGPAWRAFCFPAKSINDSNG
jgi:hypothetical protein